jgi:hypothetical protein
MHIGHTYTSYTWDISEEAPIRPGLGIYQLSKGCGSEICRIFSANYQIKVITACELQCFQCIYDATHVS